MRGVVWLAVLLVLVAGWSDAQQGACTSQTVLSKNTRVTATMEVHVVGGGTVSRTFYPQVDKYSLLDSQTTTDQLTVSSGNTLLNMTVSVCGVSAPSQVISYHSERNNAVFAPFLTFVVDLNNGRISRVRVDNTCNSRNQCQVGGVGCSSELNIGQNNCVSNFFPDCSTNPTSSTNTKCSARAFLAWEGSYSGDSGQPTSVNLLPQSFTKWTVGNVVSDLFNRAKNAF